MNLPYITDDVNRGLNYLGHKNGYTELLIFHPEYRRGKENLEWNLANNTMPIIWYTKKPAVVRSLIHKYSGYRTVCYGLNLRPGIFCTKQGFVRSAFEHEIEYGMNILFNLNFLTKNVSKGQYHEFLEFLKKSEAYFKDLGLKTPGHAFSGHGFHLILAYSPISVRECPDLADRQRAFCNHFRNAFSQQFERLEMVLDSNQDLRRIVKAYGTAKPGGLISRFYRTRRIEDYALRNLLLNLELQQKKNLEVEKALQY